MQTPPDEIRYNIRTILYHLIYYHFIVSIGEEFRIFAITLEPLNNKVMKNNRLVSLCIFFVLCSSVLFAQESPPPKAVFGIRYNLNYAFFKGDAPQDYFHVLTSQPALFVEFNQHHEVHAGAVLAHLLNPSWDYDVYYQENARGLFFGYRYNFNEVSKNLRPFGQIDGSYTLIKYRTSGLGSGIYARLFNDNHYGGYISFGVDYQVVKHLHLLSGISGGFAISHSGELFDKTLSPFLGIDYRF